MQNTTTVAQPRFEFVATRILTQRQIAKDTWKLTAEAPLLAAKTLPGQFFMVRIAGCNDPLIGRAFALYDMHVDSRNTPSAISIVYTVKGKFTQSLSRKLAGEKIELWGPLGNAFSTEPVDHLILVAGGVGQTPMLTVAASALGKRAFGSQSTPKKYANRVSLCYGARSKEHLAGLPEFEENCSDVHIATEDGSLGHHGRVTDLLRRLLNEPASGARRIACCGPEPMMKAVSEIATEYSVHCDVSLETPMACGIGICYTCVAKVKQPDGEWDYKRTCVEGPIFDSRCIDWD